MLAQVWRRDLRDVTYTTLTRRRPAQPVYLRHTYLEAQARSRQATNEAEARMVELLKGQCKDFEAQWDRAVQDHQQLKLKMRALEVQQEAKLQAIYRDRWRPSRLSRRFSRR